MITRASALVPHTASHEDSSHVFEAMASTKIVMDEAPEERDWLGNPMTVSCMAGLAVALTIVAVIYKPAKQPEPVTAHHETSQEISK